MARKDRKMAVDTQDVTTGTENEEAKAKRERVELETLDPNTKVVLQITMPAGMKLAITKAGEAETLSATAFARNKLAELTGYEIPAEFLERTREHKYATPEEAKAAASARAKEERAKMKKLLALLSSGDIKLPEGVTLESLAQS